MNLFLVIYVAGQVAGVIGPLPSEDECHRLSQAQLNSCQERPGTRVCESLLAVCEWHQERPDLDPSFIN